MVKTGVIYPASSKRKQHHKIFFILESDFLGISEWSEELERLNTTGGILEMFFCKKLGVKDAAIFCGDISRQQLTVGNTYTYIYIYIYITLHIYIYILWLETLFYQPWTLLYSNLWLEDGSFRVFEGVTFFRFCWVGSFRRCSNSFHSLVVTQFSCFILRLWNIPGPWHEIFRSERDAHQFFLILYSSICLFLDPVTPIWFTHIHELLGCWPL